MAVSAQDELLRQSARNEARKWESIFAYGESLAAKYGFTEDDVNDEIDRHRELGNR